MARVLCTTGESQLSGSAYNYEDSASMGPTVSMHSEAEALLARVQTMLGCNAGDVSVKTRQRSYRSDYSQMVCSRSFCSSAPFLPSLSVSHHTHLTSWCILQVVEALNEQQSRAEQLQHVSKMLDNVKRSYMNHMESLAHAIGQKVRLRIAAGSCDQTYIF